MDIAIVKLYAEPGVVGYPEYQTVDSAGCDIRALTKEDITIAPFDTYVFETGLAMEMPSGYEAEVRSRSGLAIKHKVIVLNSPATIDADYRGFIKVDLINLGKEPYTVHNGDRIAQLVYRPYTKATFDIVANYSDLTQTERGQGGFGHTGI